MKPSVRLLLSRVGLLALCGLFMTFPAHAATAFFTGRQEMIQTVTNQMGWRCEYQYAGKYF